MIVTKIKMLFQRRQSLIQSKIELERQRYGSFTNQQKTMLTDTVLEKKHADLQIQSLNKKT